MAQDTHYDDICGFSPMPEQIEIYKFLFSGDISKNPLIIRLPCGYGKTEAVVIPYLAQILENRWLLAPRLIYVLPTRALCNQIRDRIQGYADSVYQVTGKKIRVSVEHGVSSLDPLFFADICVTTFDQFLYGYSRAKRVGRHFDLPAGAIANSLVVFDEAHLYSPYTHSLIRAMVEILIVSRVRTVIMTATMPETLEYDLLASIENPQKIEFAGKWPSHMNSRSINWQQEGWGLLDRESLSEGLNGVLQENKGKKILIVANRVDVAQRVAKVLKNREDFISLIHSRFTVGHRNQKEKDVCEYFGKDKAKQKPGIVVSTQVCEVGLDISCDVLITECASADALVQRVGRLVRWGGIGQVFIIRPMGEDKCIDENEWGIAYPYVDKNNGQESKFSGIKKGEFAGIVWEYLKQNAPKDLFNQWEATTQFCNEMVYHTDDIEARSALGQLFDATLYADDRPWNLSARGELYCTLAVVAEKDLMKKNSGISRKTDRGGKGQGKKAKGEPQISFELLRGFLVNVSFRYLLKKDTKNFKKYYFEDDKIGDRLDKARPRPFQTYIVDPSGHYDDPPVIGLELAKREKPDDTEEGRSCLVF
ncbi:MAG: CRISPR-associated helicase Cas3' [Deltaproteobacteria bacterium]|nr:CRISPR-associated helicase Cas3' [Deltaproteobacteria bacterium]